MLHLLSPLAPTLSPGGLAFCSPKVMALVWGLKLGLELERSGHRNLEPDSLKTTHGCSSKDLGVLTELSRNSNGLLRTQKVPEQSDSCQHLGLVLREVLCQSNCYM